MPLLIFSVNRKSTDYNYFKLTLRKAQQVSCEGYQKIKIWNKKIVQTAKLSENIWKSVALLVFSGVICDVSALYCYRFFDLITLKFIWPPLLVLKITQLQQDNTHEKGTRKSIYQSMTAYKIKLSSQWYLTLKLNDRARYNVVCNT